MKNCGIGSNGASFYDVDGTRYPCVMCTPMTLSSEKLASIQNINFSNDTLFVDYSCNENCYIYPVCSNCSGSNFILRNNFANRDKTKCNIKKLIALFNAEYVGRKIIDNPKNYSEIELYNNIEVIKKIKELYYDEFYKYFM